jgi:tetratricopeptide (TPR) repeat protein
LLRRGDLALRGRRISEAEGAFRDALRLAPGLAPARQRLIWVLALGLRRDEVLAEFETLSASLPLDFDQVLLWTQVRCGIWDPDKVADRLEECLDAEPGNRRIRLALAEGLSRLGKHDRAREVLTPLGDADPEAALILARAAIERDDPDAAGAILARAAGGSSERAELEGRIALATHDPARAESFFRRALASRPDSRRSLLGLAQALQLRGRGEDRPAILDAVRKLDVLNNLVRKAAESPRRSREDGPLLRDLGSACEALGCTSEARAWFNLAITLDPLDSVAQAAQFRLNGMGAKEVGRSAPD